MGGLGAPELIIILLIVLLVFGSTKLPKLARSLGQAQKEFKTGLSEGGKDEPEAKSEPDTKSESGAKSEPDSAPTE